MKTDTIIILAAAGFGLYAIANMVKPAGAAIRPPTGSGTAGALNNYGNAPVTEITNTALPGQNGWGWTYYSDGTAIDPQGRYYFQGQLVWTPGAGSMGMA